MPQNPEPRPMPAMNATRPKKIATTLKAAAT